MGNNSLNAAAGLSLILVIAAWVIVLILVVLLWITLVRLCKVLGSIQNFFDELHNNNLSLAQIAYANATNLKTVAESAGDIATEVEGVKVVTEAIGYEDMDVYEDYKKERE